MKHQEIPRGSAVPGAAGGDEEGSIPTRRFVPTTTVSVPVPRPRGERCLYLVQGLTSRDRLVPLPEGALLIGSAAEADLCLLDPTVSGRHCEVHNEQGRVNVRDLGSKNGTWLQGARISAGEVMVGQSLRVGRASLVLLEGGAAEAAPQGEALPGLVGESLPMRRLARQVRLLAQSDLTVLVVGPTGSGKELVARALHGLSPRRQAIFIPQNCGALPESLVESELFGHERGAFTGAQEARPGLFESAQGGTLFLDEIGELPLGQQPKLLRVLESRQVRRLGGRVLIPVDVRVVAATHTALPERVQEGFFRRDLYYRLGEAVVEVPPLEARREDIPLLVAHFLAELGQSCGCVVQGAGGAPMERLRSRRYPGNVRELRNLVRRASVLGWDQALEACEEPGPVQVAARAAQARAVQARDAQARDAQRWASQAQGSQAWASQAQAIQGRSYQAGWPPTQGAAPRAGHQRAGDDLSTNEVPIGELQDHLLFEAYQAAGGNRALAAKRLGLAKSTYNDRLRRLLRRPGGQ